MMKKYIIVWIATLTVAFSNAQFATQSADGKSSLPLPLKGAGLSVDIGKAEIVFGVNNYGRVFDSIRNISFFGASLSGKNSEGFANLFNKGDIVGEGNFIAFGGYSFSNNKKILANYKASQLFNREEEIQDSINNIGKFIKDTMHKLLAKEADLLEEKDRDFILDELGNKIAATSPFLYSDVFKNYRPGEQGVRKFINTVIDHYTKVYLLYKKINNDLRERKITAVAEAHKEFVKQNIPFRINIFLQGGIRARAFKRYLGTVIPYSSSFQDTIYRGGHFGPGINVQVSDFTFGLTYSYFKSDNFSTLTSKEYTLRTTDTSRNQALIQEKKITAYPGKYSRVEVNEFNADILYSIKLDKSDTARLLLNAYVRGTWRSRDTAYVKNNTNVGFGAYFLGKKRKFIGGLYIELPDINNNIEKAKPEAERHLQPPLKRLNFGIVTKINLSSIFAFADRPRKPDQ